MVAPPAHAQVMEELHEAHLGVSRIKSFARSLGWWPGMGHAIEGKVKAFLQSRSNQKLPGAAPLDPWKWPVRSSLVQAALGFCLPI